jgi:hypothetical protein
MFFWIEFSLSALAITLAYACPELGASWFQRAEQLLNHLAQKRGLSVLVVGLTALAVRAALLPILHVPYPDGFDEFAYQLLADTFAHGRVTNPTHPMWVHFESFHIIWQPTYTAKFYPAQGLIMALGQRVMGHPYWGVWLSVGLMCAAICWMLQGWLPPGWALVGGFLAVIRLGTFSYWANSYWGGAVAATGGALVLGALPRIKQSQRVRDALLMGLGLAIVANSRPYEGLFFGLPVAGALAVWMFGPKRNPRSDAKEGGRRWTHVALPLFIMTVLTGSAMAYYFWRTTGSPWQVPFLVHARTYVPVPYFPWQPLKPVPAYHHQIMQRYYVDALVSRYQMGRTAGGLIGEIINVPMDMGLLYLGPVLALPLLMVLATIPYGSSLKDVDRKTGFLLLVCGAVTVGSMLPTVFLPHYAAPIACAVLAVVLKSMRRLRSLGGRQQQPCLFITRAIPLICAVLLALRIGAKPLHLPEPRPWLGGGVPIWCALTPSNPERAATLARLQELPGRQLAIVHYAPNHEICFHEWVYNEADIDRANVVWARDMGPAENKELIDYFHDRHVWVVEADETPPKVVPYSASP